MKNRLPLHEEVLLLALKDKKGTIDSKATFYPQIMAGAILSELLLTEKISISDSKKHLVKFNRPENLENEVLNQAFEKITKSRTQRTLKYWLDKLANMKDLKKNTAESLCEKGALDHVELKILWVFNTTHYPELDGSFEKELIVRLKKAIHSTHGEIDARTATLIALIHKTQILNIPFSKRLIKDNKKRIEAIAEGSVVGGATAEIIQAIQMTIVMTAVMPAVIAS